MSELIWGILTFPIMLGVFFGGLYLYILWDNEGWKIKRWLRRYVRNKKN